MPRRHWNHRRFTSVLHIQKCYEIVVRSILFLKKCELTYKLILLWIFIRVLYKLKLDAPNKTNKQITTKALLSLRCKKIYSFSVNCNFSISTELSSPWRFSFFKKHRVHGEDISQLHCPSGLSTRFFSFLCQPSSIGQRRNDGVSRSSIPSILSRFIVPSFFRVVSRGSFPIFFVHRRAIGKQKEKETSRHVRMQNDRLYILRNYCLSRLINVNRFGAAILLVESGYVREIRRVNSLMDSIYSCTRPVWHGDAKAKEAWKRHWLKFIPV